MNKQPTDEMIDTMMRTLMREAAMDDNAVNEIADSPTLWWDVKRQIGEQKTEIKAPWPPSIWRRVLLFATPLAAAAVIISFLVLRPAESVNNIVEMKQPVVTAASNDKKDIDPVPVQSQMPPVTAATDTGGKLATSASKPVRAISKTVVTHEPKRSLVAKTSKLPEFKSEFIALSYAARAESGQVVRVRVPSSMMVSLGLVSSVNKSTDLVDAEVIVGDDGLTRAIRFIRQ